LDELPYLEHPEFIADSVCLPLPPVLPWTETYPGTGALPCEYIANPLERDVQGWHEKNLQNNLYYLCVTCEEYKYIHCGIVKNGM
jgi:hypothetical protein